MLVITVKHESLPADIQLSIEDGNGFEDNAKAAGWLAEVPPTEEQLDAALQNMLNQKAGSPERLQAQKALQELEQSRVPNPESALQFLISLVRQTIESLLIDQAEVEAMTQAALAKVNDEIQTKLQSRMTVEMVAAA